MGLPVPHIDADALTLGPAARLFYLETDTLGRARYQVEKRKERCIPFGREQAETLYCVIDQITAAAFFRPPAIRLRALASYDEQDPLTVLFGERWGTALEPDGSTRRILDPLTELRRQRLPVYRGDEPSWLGLRMTVNPHYRELLSRELRTLVRPNRMNMVEVFFDTPSGDFVQAGLDVQEKQTQRLINRYALHGFPFAWPDSDLLAEKGDHTPPVAPTNGQIQDEPLRAPRRPQRQERPRRPVEAWARDAVVPPRPPKPAPKAPPREQPLPRTVNLPDREAVEIIGGENDARRRWKMVEENLEVASPGRTYQLLSRFGSLIGERTADWPIQKVVTLLGEQPAALIQGVAADWPVDRVLALAEASAEKDAFAEWLREREVERLMDMDPEREVRGIDDAVAWLGLGGRNVPQAQIKRVWRRLLGFLNSDYGRTREQAIHRRKDEIAKRLQQARDLLTRR